LLEGSVDSVAIETAVKETPDLHPGRSSGRCVEGLFDAVGGVVSGGGAEEEWGAPGAVVPYGECSLEMGQLDDGAAIEGSIDGAETQDLGFGPAGVVHANWIAPRYNRRRNGSRWASTQRPHKISLSIVVFFIRFGHATSGSIYPKYAEQQRPLRLYAGE
jgi:hypothetical protein